MRERMAELGEKMMRDFMPEQHRTFFAQLPFVIVGSVDAEGQPWASILANPPGFISSPDERRLLIRARPPVTDPLPATLTTGSSIALLGIEQHTRRRNRMNGFVERVGEDGILIGVQQSFGNCPKYIQARKAEYINTESIGTVHSATTLNAFTRQIVARADTLFIATTHPGSRHTTARSHGVDVSHRGGKPGFVRVDGGNTLTLPDFSGNRFFNTLGNILLNPRAGLLFVDFATGDMLTITADAEIIFAGPEVDAYTGAERLLKFSLHSIRHAVASLPLRWSGAAELSPFLENTGQWITT